ncbi:Transcriptional regulator, contains XRE-family HTH domain [Mucilaginibacter pineti]|uniref:Transcriptional regulator, contains XRE-family HTH domain n=1 Tax=Mucilaginibacter pineti TaxID=1391627 RepID=A0A1G7P590_9SPHI|nr:helix-turn-helix domain-containing protein [Mucilaginibacter pineti]SDF81506.1 Transcriptional regulator, contains XRE-family HTH domain [Mucilaginibacter pineti]
MSAVAGKIKRLRTRSGLTQEQMAERIHLTLGAWQKIENGITRIDIERLTQIAEVLETSLADIINGDEGIFVHQEIGKNENIYNKEVTVNNHISDSERELFIKIIADKDKEIDFLRGLLNDKKSSN